VVRYLIVLIGGILAGDRTVEAVHSWQEWQGRLASDPSGAEVYKHFLLINLAEAALSLSLAALLWYLLRPREPKL
jgi:hypothetical protein